MLERVLVSLRKQSKTKIYRVKLDEQIYNIKLITGTMSNVVLKLYA